MSEFKIGDIVRVLDTRAYESRCSPGDLGLVVDIETSVGGTTLLHVRFRWMGNDVPKMYAHRFEKVSEVERE